MEEVVVEGRLGNLSESRDVSHSQPRSSQRSSPVSLRSCTCSRNLEETIISRLLCVCISLLLAHFGCLVFQQFCHQAGRSGHPSITDDSSHPWSRKMGVQELEKLHILLIVWRKKKRGYEGNISQDLIQERDSMRTHLSVCAQSLQLCPALWDPINCSPPLCPQDFPGKNTGAGCHFLLQGIF